MSNLDDRLAYTREEAARVCGVSVDTIRRATNRGDLRAGRSSITDDGTPTGKYLYTRKALEDWLEGLVGA